MEPPIVSLSMMPFGDADGFDAWLDGEVPVVLQPPALSFNAIVLSMLDTTPAGAIAAHVIGTGPTPRLAA